MAAQRINPALHKHLRPLASLKPDPGNARAHGPESIQAVKGSLEQFGQQKPIVVSKDGTIIAGEGTWRAAQELGWKQIAAIKTDLKAEEARRAYALADNRSAELSGWDEETLSKVLREIGEKAGLLRAGWTEGELEALMGTVRGVDHTPDPLDPDRKNRQMTLHYTRAEYVEYAKLATRLKKERKLENDYALIRQLLKEAA